MRKNKIYGFEIGKRVIDVSAQDEQKAFKILIDKFWSFIDTEGSVNLLGEQTSIREVL